MKNNLKFLKFLTAVFIFFLSLALVVFILLTGGYIDLSGFDKPVNSDGEILSDGEQIIISDGEVISDGEIGSNGER